MRSRKQNTMIHWGFVVGLTLLLAECGCASREEEITEERFQTELARRMNIYHKISLKGHLQNDASNTPDTLHTADEQKSSEILNAAKIKAHREDEKKRVVYPFSVRQTPKYDNYNGGGSKSKKNVVSLPGSAQDLRVQEFQSLESATLEKKNLALPISAQDLRVQEFQSLAANNQAKVPLTDSDLLQKETIPDSITDPIRVGRRAAEGNEASRPIFNPLSQTYESDYKKDIVSLPGSAQDLRVQEFQSLESATLEKKNLVLPISAQDLRVQEFQSLAANNLAKVPITDSDLLQKETIPDSITDPIRVGRRAAEGNEASRPIFNPLSQTYESDYKQDILSLPGSAQDLRVQEFQSLESATLEKKNLVLPISAQDLRVQEFQSLAANNLAKVPLTDSDLLQKETIPDSITDPIRVGRRGEEDNEASRPIFNPLSEVYESDYKKDIVSLPGSAQDMRVQEFQSLESDTLAKKSLSVDFPISAQDLRVQEFQSLTANNQAKVPFTDSNLLQKETIPDSITDPIRVGRRGEEDNEASRPIFNPLSEVYESDYKKDIVSLPGSAQDLRVQEFKSLESDTLAKRSLNVDFPISAQDLRVQEFQSLAANNLAKVPLTNIGLLQKETIPDSITDPIRVGRRATEGNEASRPIFNPLSQTYESDYKKDIVSLPGSAQDLRVQEFQSLESATLEKKSLNVDFPISAQDLRVQEFQSLTPNNLAKVPLTDSDLLQKETFPDSITDPIRVGRRAAEGNEASRPIVNPLSQTYESVYQKDIVSLPGSAQDLRVQEFNSLESDTLAKRNLNLEFPISAQDLRVQEFKSLESDTLAKVPVKDDASLQNQVDNDTTTNPIEIEQRSQIEKIEPSTLENIAEANDSVFRINMTNYFSRWHLVPKELSNKLIDRLGEGNKSLSLADAISEVGSTDLFVNSFWPFKYDIVEMNQRIALYGISGKIYRDNVKSRFYKSLYDLYSLPLPVDEDKLLLSFNDHRIAGLLRRSNLLNGNDSYIENREYTYSEPEKDIVTNKINAAMNLIKETAPELHRAIHQLITCIAIYKPERVNLTGGSSRALPGVIYIVPMPNEHDWPVALYAEQIVHEFIHNNLYLEEFVIGTYNSHAMLSDTKVFSTVRKVPRNYDLSLHAAYVSTGLVVFHSRAGYSSRAEYYSYPLVKAVQGLVDANKEFGVLTVAGEAMLQTLVDYVAVMKIGRIEL